MTISAAAALQAHVPEHRSRAVGPEPRGREAQPPQTTTAQQQGAAAAELAQSVNLLV
jgi:hypothetical protein